MQISSARSEAAQAGAPRAAPSPEITKDGEVASESGVLARLLIPGAARVHAPAQQVEVAVQGSRSAGFFVARTPRLQGELEHLEVAHPCRQLAGAPMIWATVLMDPPQHLQIPSTRHPKGRPMIPRTSHLPRQSQELPVLSRCRELAGLFVARAAVLARPAKDLVVSFLASVVTDLLIPRASVLMGILEHMEVPPLCSLRTRVHVPRTAEVSRQPDEFQVPTVCRVGKSPLGEQILRAPLALHDPQDLGVSPESRTTHRHPLRTKSITFPPSGRRGEREHPKAPSLAQGLVWHLSEPVPPVVRLLVTMVGCQQRSPRLLLHASQLRAGERKGWDVDIVHGFKDLCPNLVRQLWRRSRALTTLPSPLRFRSNAGGVGRGASVGVHLHRETPYDVMKRRKRRTRSSCLDYGLYRCLYRSISIVPHTPHTCAGSRLRLHANTGT